MSKVDTLIQRVDRASQAIREAPFGEDFDIDGVTYRKVIINAHKVRGRCSTWPCPAWGDGEQSCDRTGAVTPCCERSPDTEFGETPTVVPVTMIPRLAMKGILR